MAGGVGSRWRASTARLGRLARWSIVVSVLLIALASAAEAAPTGGVVGTVTADGAPVAGVEVTVFNSYYGNALGTAVTDATGNYALTGLNPQTAKVRFSSPNPLWRTTFHPSAPTFTEGTTLAVPANGTITADGALLSNHGAIGGSVTGPDASPLAGIVVNLLDPTTRATQATTTTGADGRYTVQVATGTYLVGFTDPTGAYAPQFVADAPSWGVATPLAIGIDTTVTADASLSRPGTVTGKVTSTSSVALGGMFVLLGTVDPPSLVASAKTNPFGNFTLAGVHPGTYKVLFIDPAWASDPTTGFLPQLFAGITARDLAHLATAHAGAASITVTSSGTTTGINASLDHTCDSSVYHPGTDLSDTWLVGKRLRFCDLTGANLHGANLTRADLTGSDLTGTDLTAANLSQAVLAGAAVTGADVTGATLERASFARSTGVNEMIGLLSTLTGTWSGTSFAGTGLDLTGADLSGAQLNGTDLTGATLTGATMTDAHIPAAKLTDVVGINSVHGLLTTLPYEWVGVDFTGTHLDLSGVDLRGRDLGYANLATVDFTDALVAGTSFSHATNINAATGLHSTAVHGWSRTNLSWTGLDLSRTDLAAIDATFGYFVGVRFDGADLTNADFRYSTLDDAHLVGATVAGLDVSGASVWQADLTSVVGINQMIGLVSTAGRGWARTSFADTGLDLTGVDLASQSANLTGGNFAGVDFTRANLTGRSLDGADFTGANLAQAMMTDASMVGANFTNARNMDSVIGLTSPYGRLAGANFTGTTLKLHGAWLNNRDLHQISLPAIDVSLANLSGSNLTAANLAGTNLALSNLTGANLTGANLTGANLYLTTLTGVVYSNTTCRDGTNSDAHGNTCAGH